MTRAATLKDVARLARVSTATVARVLHNNGYVAEETRAAVEVAIAQTGYQLNAVAQGLRKRRTLTLGHVVLHLSPNPFFAGVALGVEQAAAASGCGVLVVNTHGDPAHERLGVETLIRRRVDAILFTTCVDAANARLALAAGIPVVQVERSTPVATHAVTVDNYRGSFEATEHLIGLGHRRIAYLGETPEGASNAPAGRRSRIVERERVSGYVDALRIHQLPVDDTLIDLRGTYNDLGHARAATRRFLALPIAQRPTAIFATCDLLAAGVLQEIYVARLRVPDDLSVVGFDDTHAAYLAPPLTTVAQPMVEIGRTAARLVLDQLVDLPSHPSAGANGQPRVLTARLATRLMVRESTGPAPTPPD
jgi:LacI family transcriptional regulator, galactose operon repressor